MSIHLEQVRRALQHGPKRAGQDPDAAVAAILTPRMDLVFMLRAKRAGDPWSGHLCFPGGHVEVRDPSPLHTAIRETHEEIGLDLARAELLGELDQLEPLGARGLAIRPFVFALREPPACRPNHEVASVHTCALAALKRGEGRATMPYRWHGREVTLPCVDFDGVRLWGVTLRMVDALLERLP